MSIRLISHVNRDDDLIEAWLQHYLRLGVESFHLIVHGGRDQNRTLHALRDRYPVALLDEYEGVFDVFEKRDRLTWGLAKLREGWIVLVDSDEFVELPHHDLGRTIRMMRWLRADALSAPMLQRFAADGAVDVTTTQCPFTSYPWCSTDLYAQLGQPQAVIDKYPVFELTRQTALRSGGNHYPPNGFGSRVAPMLAVTHHFKWRATVRDRLRQRATSTHPYRGESVQYLSHLEGAGWQLPIAGAFQYSRAALVSRGLLTRSRLADLLTRRADVVDMHGGKDRVFSYMASPQTVACRVAAAGYTSVTLCGAGSGGRMFLQALERHGVQVTRIVDRNPAHWGTRVQGVPVVGIEAALASGARVFVAGSLNFGAEMAADVQQHAVRQGVEVTVFAASDLEAAA